MKRTNYIPAMVGLSMLLPATSSEALGRDVSRREIRALVQQEVSKVKAKRGPHGDRGMKGHPGQKGGRSEARGDRGATGIAGPAGPAGPDGSPQVFFAHIFPDGSIEQETAAGINQENVRRSDVFEDPDNPHRFESIIRYCLSGLPRRIWGGQVTVDAASIDHIAADFPLKLMPSFRIHTNMEEPDCAQQIIVWNGIAQGFSEGNEAVSFYLLLY